MSVYTRVRIASVAGLLLVATCADPPSPTEAPLGVPPRFGLAQADYVNTPAGWWHRSCVHAIPQGARQLRGGQIRRTDGTTYRIPDCTYQSYPRGEGILNARLPFHPPTIGGWVEYTKDVLSSGYRQLEAKWVVPSNPSGYNGTDVYYAFPGLQTAIPSPDSIIVQPVLQFGYNGLFGSTTAWRAASWHCDVAAGGNCSHTTPITVSAGDSIYGSIEATGCQSGTCTWAIVTHDITSDARTSGSWDDPDSIYVWSFGGVVEAYNLDSCSQFPVTGIFFSSISLSDESGSVTPTWSNIVTSGLSPSCGYSVSSTTTTASLFHNPPPPLLASIDGPSEVPPQGFCSWSADVSGGDPPYTYAWWIDDDLVSTSASYNTEIGSSGFFLELEVTDDANDTDWDQLNVTVDSGSSECPVR